MKMIRGISDFLGRVFATGFFLVGCVLHIPEPQLFVEGVVRDAETGKPIEGAYVSDDGYGSEPFSGAVTDAEGKYQYLTWYEEHTIVATATGYKTQRHLLRTKVFGIETQKAMNFDLVPEESV